jgi:N-acetylglucosaminyldiphosphoundecaprenol N-acetyl-beta-D-mannosaminyltransferase
MSNTVNILSVNVSTSDLNETIQIFKHWISNGEKKRVCVTPVNCILWAFKNPILRNLYNTSAMNLADGVPLLWASRLLGNTIRGRVTGLDLLPEFAKVGNHEKYRFFFLGAKDGVAEKLAQQFLKQYPDLRIVGTYAPPFADKFSEEENQKMISLVNEAKPHVLWVSLTAPKQDYWIYDNFDRLNINIAIGVGGAFEVTAGLIKRAPNWMQRCGLEWFFRFLQEPRRLFKRYIIEAPQFIPLIFWQKIKVITNRNFKN